MCEFGDGELPHSRLFDNAAVGIYVCHKDGHYLACNKTFACMLGYADPADVIRMGHSVDERVYVEEGRRAALLHELQQGKTLRSVESQIYGCEGDTIWVSEHLGPYFDENGQFMYYEGVVINITARKKAEDDRALAYALVQHAMDAIADFIVVADLEGNIIATNKAFDTELDAAVRITEAGRVLSFVNDAQGPLAMFKHMAQSAPEQSRSLRQHCRVPGYVEELDATASPYTAPDGELMGAVIVMRSVDCYC